MKDRLDKIVEMINNLNLDGVLLTNLGVPMIDYNFIYIVQPRIGIFEGASLLITPDSAVLYVSRLEESAARALELARDGRLKVVPMDGYGKLHKDLKRLRRVGMNLKFTPYHIYKRVADLGLLVMDVSDELEEMRMVKDKDEIELIRKASRIAEGALRETIGLDVRRMRESELKAELEYRMVKYGGEIAFPTIVAYDENASFPHYTTGANDKLPEKLILIDFGAKYRNYVCDITRTFILSWEEEIVKAYKTVLSAQLKAIEMIRAGIEAEKPDIEARDTIKAEGYPDYPHSLGHMIGVNVHEGKRLRKGEKYKLIENMVFTVEPGIYLEGKFGIRIEDDIVVKRGGAEVITSFPKDPEQVKI